MLLQRKYERECPAALKDKAGNFPVTQWLRRPCSHCRGLGFTLVGELRSGMPHGVAKRCKKEKKKMRQQLGIGRDFYRLPLRSLSSPRPHRRREFSSCGLLLRQFVTQ